MPIESFAGVLLISSQAEKLRDFYKDVLGLPLVDEIHEGVPLHYACDLGTLHLAIHSSEGWPGVATQDAQSPVVLFNASEVEDIANRLRLAGVEASGPYDHGFAHVVSFRDPDGNLVEIMQPKEGGGT